MDASVARAVDKYSDNIIAVNNAKSVGLSEPEEVDVDTLFDELENEDDSGLREKRLAQLHRELNEIKALKEKEHGQYTEIKDEKAVLDLTTSTKRVVAHFFHKDFRRCQIVDQHLEGLAKKHYQTKFIKVDVDNVPFLVVSLKIQVLPCIIAFIDGIGTDRIVGFEDLGNTDNFSTARLEYRLIQTGLLYCDLSLMKGVISRPRVETEDNSRSILGFGTNNRQRDLDDDSDYD